MNEYSLKWDSLHDFTLISMTMDWKSGETSLLLRGDVGYLSIVAKETCSVSCPRRSPWGESVSINEVRKLQVTKAPYTRLEIEMQSGDLIELEAESFEIKK